MSNRWYEVVPPDVPAEAAAEDVDGWLRDLESAVSQIPAEEHDRFRRAIEEIELQSKQAVRREWGLE